MLLCKGLFIVYKAFAVAQGAAYFANAVLQCFAPRAAEPGCDRDEDSESAEDIEIPDKTSKLDVE